MSDNLPAGPDTVREIARETFTALERLNASPVLLAIVARWRDGGDEGEIVQELQRQHGSVRQTKPGEPKFAISAELYTALERLNAPVELMALFDSWGDGEDDGVLLRGLRLFNQRGSIFNDGTMQPED